MTLISWLGMPIISLNWTKWCWVAHFVAQSFNLLLWNLHFFWALQKGGDLWRFSEQMWPKSLNHFACHHSRTLLRFDNICLWIWKVEMASSQFNSPNITGIEHLLKDGLLAFLLKFKKYMPQYPPQVRNTHNIDRGKIMISAISAIEYAPWDIYFLVLELSWINFFSFTWCSYVKCTRWSNSTR